MNLDHEHWYLPPGVCIDNSDKCIGKIVRRVGSPSEQEEADRVVRPLISFLLQAYRGYSPSNADPFSRKAALFFGEIEVVVRGETTEEKISSSMKAFMSFLSEEYREELILEDEVLEEICDMEYPPDVDNALAIISEIEKCTRQIIGDAYSNYPDHVAAER